MFNTLFSMRAVRAAAAFAVIAPAAGCGGGGGGDQVTGIPIVGTFTAMLTGDSEGTYTGFTDAVVVGSAFSIGLMSVDGKFALAFSRVGGRPATGTYTFGTSPLNGFVAALNINSGEFVYTSARGTLTITSSSSTEIKGTFSFTGAATVGNGAAAATGSFTSGCTAGC